MREFYVHQYAPLPGGAAPVSADRIANAILDVIEPGASGHCRRITSAPAGHRAVDVTHEHYRLGVKIVVRVPTHDQDHNPLVPA